MLNKSSLSGKVYAFTVQEGLLEPDAHVLIGVSGGADSMALLHCMHTCTELRLKLTVLHIHHGLRVEADEDADFVRRYCEENHISFILRKVDVRQYANEHACSIEEAGRHLRYAEFDTVRAEVGADYVLTAHTASDQAETVLMRLIRGCGTDGLVGIPAKRDRIRRPLLCCTRAEVEDYCAEHAIPNVTDCTNMDPCYTRNRIRHEVLPLLRMINPAVDEALVRLSRHAGEDVSTLRDAASRTLSEARGDEYWRVSHFLEQSVSVRRRMIALLLRHIGVSTYDECHILSIENLLFSGCGEISLPNGKILTVEQGRVFALTHDDISLSLTAEYVGSLPFQKQINGTLVELKLLKDVNVHTLLANWHLDYDKIQGDLYIRSRREGDYVHPAGRRVGKSIKKLMNEWRIPAHLRDSFPLLCDDAGIVLVPGYACDQRVCCEADTKHFLVWVDDTVQG